MRLKRGRRSPPNSDAAAATVSPGRPGKRRGSALSAAQRGLTPTRCLAVVALAAAFSLGGSQFADYRAVEVGTPDYRSIENTVPAPQLDQRSPRSAHGSWVLAIAGISVIVIALAVVRDWRLPGCWPSSVRP